MHPLAKFFQGEAYDEIYRDCLWANVAVNKLSDLQMQLPRKTYERADKGRLDARSSGLGQIMLNPSMDHNPYVFWSWFSHQHHVHGISFAYKIRNRAGKPAKLALIHSSRMRYGPRDGGHLAGGFGATVGPNQWWFKTNAGPEISIPRRELLIWPRFDPKSPHLGMSRLEPLRKTLQNEESAREANAATWRNGGKHNLILKHPRTFDNGRVQANLRKQYEEKYGGVEQWGRPLVLEEGMDAVQIESKFDTYIDVRKINREEVAAEFDIPPPLIHILDRATFSNVSEQNRMLYRLTMPPILNSFEAMIDFDLRDGRFGDQAAEPEFGADFYFEYLIDGVLRGDFEQRVDAYTKQIYSGQATPAEVRDRENMPFIEGSDRLMINAATISLDEAIAGGTRNPTAAEQQAFAEFAALVAAGPDPLSVVMGRFGHLVDVADIDPDRLVEGLADSAAVTLRALVARAVDEEWSVAHLRDAVKQELKETVTL